MTKLINYRTVLILLFCAATAAAQNNTGNIDSYFNKIAQAKQLNGNMLLAIYNHVIYERSFGYADFDAKRPNTRNSHFNLASISKVFTSTAVLQLRDKGRLSLDDHFDKYFPDFPFHNITIRHLLTHTSGLPDLELYESLVHEYPDTVITDKNIIPELKKWKQGLQFNPGDKFRYCNTGFCLLAMLVEKVSGMPFSKYLQKNIFQPAGMHTTYIDTYPSRRYDNDPGAIRAYQMPHPYYDTTYASTDTMSRYKYLTHNCRGLTGQGNVISTTDEILRFDAAFFGGKLLKPASINEALSPVKLNNGKVYYDDRMDTMLGDGKASYGLGWEIFDQPIYGRSVGHGGYMIGLATFYIHNLSKNQTVIAFDNTAGSEFGRIVTSAFALLHNSPPLDIRTKKSLVGLYGMALVSQGADHAASLFNASKSDTAHFYLSEWEMNYLGGDLFHLAPFPGHRTLGLEVFKIATFVFPNSFNTYDSYANALRLEGKKQEAILMYRKSVELNPTNEDGKRALQQLVDEY
ncbi:MAG TPA: serine hydrolase domain-containing protein [Mucilaginibacter sp.]|nr:serine hydrolase domain-containing protein [Mucilaginibacter sp.]